MEINDYITVKEAGQLLGLSRNAIYRIWGNEKWPSIKIGVTRLFLRVAVQATPPAHERKPYHYKHQVVI